MSITLKYWNGRGLMEVPRVCLAIAGKSKDTDYVDGRHSAPADNLEANLGRMPCVQCGDCHIGQSVAINFAVASECGLMGSNTMEAAQILAIQEHLKEMGAAFRNLCSYGTEPSAEVLDKWFDTGATDVSGPADRAGYSTRFLTWWMGRIEACLGDNFAVGGKLSLADVLMYNTFAEYLKPEEAAADTPAWKREVFGSKDRMDAKLKNYPKIQASINACAANAGFQNHLATRGVQGF
jgi:glutathione S-transferase